MIPTEDGLYHGYPTSIAVNETGPNNLVTAVIDFSLVEQHRGNEWLDCSAEALAITGYFYIEKRDGSLNTTAIDQLRAALGWDGVDPFWLQDNDLSGVAVQVKLGFEEYEGKNRLKVQFLNPYGSTGGATEPGGDDVRRSVAARLGAKLRANAGGTSRPTPTPATPAPPAPGSAPPSAPPAAPAAEATTSTQEEAWTIYATAAQAAGVDQATMEGRWFELITKTTGKPAAELSPEEWGKVKMAIEVAIEAGDAGDGNDIPF